MSHSVGGGGRGRGEAVLEVLCPGHTSYLLSLLSACRHNVTGCLMLLLPVFPAMMDCESK